MKIVLIGTRGQLGWEMARVLMPLGELVAGDREVFDLANPEEAARAVAAHRPDVIVNAAAYTAVDKAETEVELAHTLNAAAPGALAQAARETGALLVHYSTDYVFDGSGDAPREVDAPTGPLNVYGHSKLAGEQAIVAGGCDYLIFRTSWVYASRASNFVRTMLRLGAERESLSIVADQIGAPTWARTIADASAFAMWQAARERQTGGFVPGIHHLCARGETSWHGFAEAIFALAEARLPGWTRKVGEITPIASEAYPVPALRPKNSRLAVDGFEARFGLTLPHWHDALVHCVDELAQR